MRITATSVIALRALRRNKMRSILTALGIIIGVGAVIATVSIGNGAKNQVESQIASLGQNVISVFPGSTNTGGTRGGFGAASTLTLDDAEAIEREVLGVVAVSAEVRDRQQVLANGLNWNTTVMGESPGYLSVRAWDLAQGNMFTDADMRSTSKVAIIGQTVATELYPDVDPVGQTIRIRNLPFKILGVLKSKGFSFFGSDQDDVVIVPTTSAMRRVARRQYLSSILIQAQSQEMMPRIQQDVTDLLQQRRGDREVDFTVRNQLELAEAATATSKTMTVLLGSIAGVSLIVGGIGIMNIMLVSVTERTREIGIRLAVGARARDVLRQFLLEAVLLSAVGGLLGIACGYWLAPLLTKFAGFPTLISQSSVILAFTVSAIIGVVFGFFPALKAANLDPIEALRYE